METLKSKFDLPPAPASETSAVKAWHEPVVIPTYLPQAPDKNPMFLEKRVYQGSSGCVYPLPFTDRIATEPVDRAWEAVHIENDFIRVMILPEIGGRIHVGLDKSNGYDFFYRQNVIKPALVGLAGPWASGGMEFNWPQHHRPATFMPVETSIERHADGSCTIWCSDHDPMNRLKGMHGVCLHPDRSVLELKVRLYNRTPFVQTFLWWANAAVHVHEQYQSFLPPDVTFVADHARRAMSAFPLCEGTYYGVDYAARARDPVPVEQRPPQFVPPGTYPPNDLSWYANIPVPTSYMALGSRQDFSGGYDHRRKAGLIHTANHHIAPGKKQWTWGNQEFGYAWDRNLTDSDGPYIELMAGVYTDNQPDFSFLAPGETRTFSQFWYPIQQTGPVCAANADGAIGVQPHKSGMQIGVSVSRTYKDARIVASGKTWKADLAPGKPFTATLKAAGAVSVQDSQGNQVVAYTPASRESPEVPPPATEPPFPRDIESNDELYLIGVHLDQYRHVTRLPEIYWQEALRRDPGDSRCNNALGLWHLRRGEFCQAEAHLRRAIRTLTLRNANPNDGEPFYNLGLTLRYLGRDDEAYDAFYKATWNFAWRAPAYQALAEIDLKQGRWSIALDHTGVSLRHNSDNLNAWNLRIAALRKLGRTSEAEEALQQALGIDSLNAWTRHMAGLALNGGNPLLLDVAFDYLRCGFGAEAQETLSQADLKATDGSVPIVLYARGEDGSQAPPDYCFPSRLEELLLLEAAIRIKPADASAHYYLGNWHYDRRRHCEAIHHWEESARLNSGFPTVWRNLGIAYFNVARNRNKARAAFEQAWKADPSDARILYERDQLWKRLKVAPARRLRELESRLCLVHQRDDLSVELATLYNLNGRHEDARRLLGSRQFQPWEGGEGLALGQYVQTHIALGRLALGDGKVAAARDWFAAARNSPNNLGEAWHPLANQSQVRYWLGEAFAACGDEESAKHHWSLAAGAQGDFQKMSVCQFSEMTYYSARAMQRLGRNGDAADLLAKLKQEAHRLARLEPKLDYFATSLPTMLLFDEDGKERNGVTALFLEVQASFGLGQIKRARRLIKELLERDPNHALAADFAAAMGAFGE